jgi:hypothetical protein
MTALSLSWVLVVDPAKMRGQPLPRRVEAQVRVRAISQSAIAAARPHVLDELLRRAARRKWAGVDAKAFMRAMAQEAEA